MRLSRVVTGLIALFYPQSAMKSQKRKEIMKKIARLIVRHPNPVIHSQSTNRYDEYNCKSHQHTLTP